MLTAVNWGIEVPSGASVGLWRREETIPSQCFDSCDSAYQVLQTSGRSPEICQNGSPFLELSNLCNKCIDRFGDAASPGGGAIRQIQQGIDYCAGLDSYTVTEKITVDGTAYVLSTHTITSLPMTTVTDTSTFVYPSEYLSEKATNTFTVTALNTFLVTATRTEVALEEVSYQPSTKAPSTNANTTNSGSESTRSRSDPTQSEAETTQPQVQPTQSSSNGNQGGRNLAWIAGPIIGGLAAIAILIVLGFLLRKRRQRAAANGPLNGDEEQDKGRWDKPELQANPPRGELEDTSSPLGPPPELHSNHLLGELEDTNTTRQLQGEEGGKK